MLDGEVAKGMMGKWVYEGGAADAQTDSSHTNSKRIYTHPNTVNGTIYRIIMFIYKSDVCLYAPTYTSRRSARSSLPDVVYSSVWTPIWGVWLQSKFCHDQYTNKYTWWGSGWSLKFMWRVHGWERFTLKVCVVLGLENTSSGCSLSRGCRPTLSSVTALCARLGEPLCFCKQKCFHG